jgi:hypothetical protein
MPSKIQIVNLAFARLGAASIRSFSEDNKHARTAEVFFDILKDALLESYDWSFARATATLQALDEDHDYYTYVYQLPSDCLTPRYISLNKQLDVWEREEDKIITNVADAILVYTKRLESTGLFTPLFCIALSSVLAVRMCPIVTQDKELQIVLNEEAKTAIGEAMLTDANVGNTYRYPTEQPEEHSFVNPDISMYAEINADTEEAS